MRLLIISIALLCSVTSNAYEINGEYARLISCDWGQSGYESGNIGTYKTSRGQIYTIFFGSRYCPT